MRRNKPTDVSGDVPDVEFSMAINTDDVEQIRSMGRWKWKMIISFQYLLFK